MPSKFGVSHDQNLHIFGGSKMSKFEGKKCFAPNAPKDHLGVSHDQNLHNWGDQNAHFGGSKMPKFEEKKCFAPNAAQSHVGFP